MSGLQHVLGTSTAHWLHLQAASSLDTELLAKEGRNRALEAGKTGRPPYRSHPALLRLTLKVPKQPTLRAPGTNQRVSKSYHHGVRHVLVLTTPFLSKSVSVSRLLSLLFDCVQFQTCSLQLHPSFVITDGRLLFQLRCPSDGFGDAPAY